MSNLTFSDLVNEAWNTGKDAVISYNGNTYSFSPEGILEFINTEITIPAPTTIDASIIDWSSVPTDNPEVAGSLWNNEGVLTISTGA